MTVHHLRLDTENVVELAENQEGKPSLQFILPKNLNEVIALAVVKTLSKALPEAASTVELSTQDLTQRFRNISQSADQQAVNVLEFVQLVSTFQVGDKRISFDEFLQFFNETLTEAVNRIIHISKNAMELVYTMDEAISHLKDVDNFINRIQRITSQTNLLALNAKIEAVRAGEVLGRNFGVVANEVKTLSRSVAELSNEMKTKLGKISQSVNDSYEILRDVATSDMSHSINAKETLETMIDCMTRQNESLKAAMENAASTTNSISADINRIVVGMQFQDRNTQLMENAVIMLNCLLERIIGEGTDNSTSVPTAEEKAHALEELMSHIKLGDMRSTCKKICEEQGLLPPSEDHTDSSGNGKTGSGESDVIELF